MIGNDIVDLNLAKIQSNWRRRGYLQKVFTCREREQIFASENKEKLIWLFWSMKESAYKAWQRKNNLPPKFNPQGLECFLHSISSEKATGKVVIGKDSYLTRSFLNSHFIHSFAGLNENIIWKSFSSGENLYQSLLLEIKETAGPFSELPKLSKDRNNIPQIFINKQILTCNFSLSHHGNFSGFALSLNNS